MGWQALALAVLVLCPARLGASDTQSLQADKARLETALGKLRDNGDPAILEARRLVQEQVNITTTRLTNLQARQTHFSGPETFMTLVKRSRDLQKGVKQLQGYCVAVTTQDPQPSASASPVTPAAELEQARTQMRDESQALDQGLEMAESLLEAGMSGCTAAQSVLQQRLAAQYQKTQSVFAKLEQRCQAIAHSKDASHGKAERR